MIIARLIVPIAVAVAVLQAGAAAAQGAFPAPLPGQSTAPAPATPANASPFPGPPSAPQSGAPSPFPATGAAPMLGGGFGGGPAPPTAGASDACMKGFVPLRAEAEKRGKALQAAGQNKKSTPEEACKLLGNYGQAELKMMKFIEANAAKCQIPPQVGEKMKQDHKNTEAMQQKVCGVAQQVAQQKAAATPSLSEVLGSASAPEATPSKKGGSTFDTLNGNVLSR